MENGNFYYEPYVDSSQNVPDPESFGASQKYQSNTRPAQFPYSSSPTYSFSSREEYGGGTTLVSPTDSSAGAGLYETYTPPGLRHPSHPDPAHTLTPQTAFHPRGDLVRFAAASPTAPLSTSSPHHSSVYQQTLHDHPVTTANPSWHPHYHSGFQFTDQAQMVFRGAANIQVLEQTAEPEPWGGLNYGGALSGSVNNGFITPTPVKGRMRSSGRDNKPEPIQTGAINKISMSEATVSRRRSSKAAGTRSRGKRQRAVVALPSPTRQSTVSPTGTTLASDENDDDFDSDQGTSTTPGGSKNVVARARHNKVEQKYRHRLNYHFEQLLAVLPNSINESSRPQSGDGVSAEGGQGFSPVNAHGGSSSIHTNLERERRVSKGEVLDRARLHIQTLQDDGARLNAENSELKEMWAGYCRAHEEARGRDQQRGSWGSGSAQRSPVAKEGERRF